MEENETRVVHKRSWPICISVIQVKLAILNDEMHSNNKWITLHIAHRQLFSLIRFKYINVIVSYQYTAQYYLQIEVKS